MQSPPFKAPLLSLAWQPAMMVPVAGGRQLRPSRASLHFPAADPGCFLTSLSDTKRAKSDRRSRVTPSRGSRLLRASATSTHSIRPHWPGASPDPAPTVFRERASSQSSLAELPCAMSGLAAAPASEVDQRRTSGEPSSLQDTTAGGGVICITGFGEFDGVKHNPTETLVQRIQGCLEQAQALVQAPGSSVGPAAEACRSLDDAEGPEGPFLAHEAAKGTVLSTPWSTAPTAFRPLPIAGSGRPAFRLRLDPQPKPGSADGTSDEEVWLELPEGWTLGHCQVLPVVGKDNLSNLRSMLTKPLASTQSPAVSLNQVAGERRALAATSSGSDGSHLGSASYTEQGAALAVEILENHDNPQATVSLSAVSLQRSLHGQAQTAQQTSGAPVAPIESPLTLGGTQQPTKLTFGKRVIWMHLGVYSGIDRFHLEERAWNEATFRAADESGWMPAREPICPEDGSVRNYAETDLPLSQLAQELKREGFPVATSTDAGRFVCNYVYYQSLRECRRVNSTMSLAVASGNVPRPACTILGGSGQGPKEQKVLEIGGGEQQGRERWSSLFVHVPDFSAVSEATQLKFLARLMQLLCRC